MLETLCMLHWPAGCVSKLTRQIGRTHLINAGKYSAGVVYYTLYFNYRIRGQYVSPCVCRTRSRRCIAGSRHHGAPFALFLTFAAINSLYSLVWDLLMDWNLCNRNARHRFLRNELAYKSQHWVSCPAISDVRDSTDPCLSDSSITLPSWLIQYSASTGRFIYCLIPIFG